MKNVRFVNEIPKIDQYWELFAETGWNDNYNFEKDELEKALQNSWFAVSTYFDDDLIGFGRIIADGVHHALIVDMIVAKKHQGNSIGQEILNRLINKCKEHNIRDVQLFAAKDKAGFYEKNGFYKRAEDAPGMQLKY